MNVLDIFSGLEGWSKPWREREHKVVTVDINPDFKPTITADIETLSIETLRDLGPFDVIMASPPCTEFSKANMPKSWKSIQRFGCNPDTKLLKRTVQIIQELNPRFWVIENVRGAIPYFIGILGKPVKKVGSRYLWGKLPMFDAEPKYGKWKLPRTSDRAAKRAIIPYSLALNFCIACERECC